MDDSSEFCCFGSGIGRACLGWQALLLKEAGLAVQGLWGEPQLMVMEERARSRGANIGHHIDLRAAPELPVAVPAVD